MRLVRTSLLSVSALQLPSPFGRAPCKTFSRAGDVLLLDWNSHLFSSRLNINEKERPPESTVLKRKAPASVVGDELLEHVDHLLALIARQAFREVSHPGGMRGKLGRDAVSYTHLTLPTILQV